MGCKCCKSIVQNGENADYISFFAENRCFPAEITTPFPKRRYNLIAVLWERCRNFFGRRLAVFNLRQNPPARRFV